MRWNTKGQSRQSLKGTYLSDVCISLSKHNDIECLVIQVFGGELTSQVVKYPKGGTEPVGFGSISAWCSALTVAVAPALEECLGRGQP